MNYKESVPVNGNSLAQVTSLRDESKNKSPNKFTKNQKISLYLLHKFEGGKYGL